MTPGSSLTTTTNPQIEKSLVEREKNTKQVLTLPGKYIPLNGGTVKIIDSPRKEVAGQRKVIVRLDSAHNVKLAYDLLSRGGSIHSMRHLNVMAVIDRTITLRGLLRMSDFHPILVGRTSKEVFTSVVVLVNPI